MRDVVSTIKCHRFLGLNGTPVRSPRRQEKTIHKLNKVKDWELAMTWNVIRRKRLTVIGNVLTGEMTPSGVKERNGKRKTGATR